MTCNTFIFTTGDGTRTQPLPVTLDAVLAMSTEQMYELCLFMDPNGDYTDMAGDDLGLLTAFVIYHTLSISIEVARDTETGMVMEPWTVEDVDAQLLWCADHSWDFVQESIQEECRYTPVCDCTLSPCCGAEVTFHDETLCCKVCWGEVQDGGAA